MRIPRRLTVLTLAVAATFALGSTVTACGSSKAAAETPAYLFVFDGFDATMTPVAGTNDAYTFSADLNCVDISDCSPVAWFTDRPVRDSGTLDVSTFVAMWSTSKNDGFRADPPNVAIEVPARSTANGQPETIIAEMSAPALHTDPTTGVWMSATMTIIPAEQLDDPAMARSHLGGHTDTVHTDVPGVIGDVTVFVDDAGAWSAAATTCEKSCPVEQAHPMPSTAAELQEPDAAASAPASGSKLPQSTQPATSPKSAAQITTTVPTKPTTTSKSTTTTTRAVSQQSK